MLAALERTARAEDPALAGLSAERGAAFFKSTHGNALSCASCHTDQPSNPGRHAKTGKPIAALAPGANPERFRDAAKVEKWFRRNCNDVLGRACTAREQGDVLAYLVQVTVSARAVLTMVLACASAGASADRPRSVVANATWVAECGTCHVAYPPQLLSAASWRAVMSGLGQHFGTDASVDPDAARELLAYAEAHGAVGKRSSAPTTLRISETCWFRRKHDELPADVWKRASIRSAANCPACHRGAEQGDFSERAVRVPR